MEKVVSVILIIGIFCLAAIFLYRSYTKPLVPPRENSSEDTADVEEPGYNWLNKVFKYLFYGVFFLIIWGISWAFHGDEISETWKDTFRWDDRYKWIYVYGIISIVIIIILFSINWRKRKMDGDEIEKPTPTDEADNIVEEQQLNEIESSNSISQQEDVQDMEPMDITLPDSTTRTSLMMALRKLNVQYEFDEDQNFLVTYQGEQFRIIAVNERSWIHVQDCWWYGASLDDTDNLALLHRAVNECNIRDVNKIVYTYNKIEREIGLHTLRDLLWMPEIHNQEQYVQATFDSMLRSHHFFFRMMEDMRREEFEKSH